MYASQPRSANMSSENGVCLTPTGSAGSLVSRKHRRLPTPPTSSSPDISCDSNLQPPPLPYVPGACFDIKPHNPPPPLDNGAWYEKPDPQEWNRDPWPRGKGAPDTVVEQLLAHPLRKTIPHSDQTPRCLQVTHQIRCGYPCKAQVVRCLVEGRDLVAKIFDPLYVGLDHEWDFPPTYYSERFYSCEAAAYMRIKERGLDGKFTPQFEGCWFLELLLPDAKGRVVRREVRLILQQFVPGEAMQALMERGEVENIDPQVRMDLLARTMEICSQLDFIGVINDDVHPRNLIVANDAEEEWHITLIDFSHSRVKDLPNSKWRTRRGENWQLPESPITTFWGSWPGGCSEWVPKQYDGEAQDGFERALKWMKDRWEGSSHYEAVNYEWVRRPFENDPTEDDASEEDSSDDDARKDGAAEDVPTNDGSIEEGATEGDSYNDNDSSDDDFSDDDFRGHVWTE